MTRDPLDRMRLLPSRHQIALVAALVAALAAATAGSAVAQAPVERPATHVVKKGDTLWDLAKAYLGDAFQWPQIYKLNAETIRDPHWIYPGQLFKLPGGAMGTAEVAAAPAATKPEVTGGATSFNPAFGHVESRTRASVLSNARRTAVRAGDFEAAPFLWSDGGPTDAGKLDGTAEPAGVVLTLNLRPIQFREEVFVTMPRDKAAAVGQTLLVYRMAEKVSGQGQVVVPTGELRVLSLMDGNRARANLIRQFEDVYPAQSVAHLDTLAMPLNVFPTRVEFGISTRVSWLYADPKLAGVGGALILAATAAQGLVTGDQVTLRRPRPPEGGAGLPDEDLAVAQVTRVTQWGVSAVIISLRDAGIVAGMKAQVTAKMP